VRTTLKRGIGQSVDGNGRGFLPPGALTAVRRYRQPDRRRTTLGLVGRILLWVGAAVLMVVAALAGGVYLFFHQSVADVRAHSREVRIAQKHLKAPPPGRPAIALVIGYDKRWGEVGHGRSDTLMLVRADPNTRAISMLSFPRDLNVPIFCPGSAPFTDKINAAFATCNVQGAVATVKNLTGLDINYLITVNFKGFRQIVDHLGGVWIDVDHRYFNRNVGTADTNYANINLRPGYQRLKGRQALEYVRFRHTDSDLYRNARQQAFVRALKEQVQRSVGVFDIPKLVGSITKNVEIGRGGGGGPSEREVYQYARFAYNLPPGHFFQSRIEGITGYSDLHADPASIQAAVADFVNPDVAAPEKAEEVILGRRPGRKRTVRPRDVSVSVLNGNAVEGSAAAARSQLAERGFRTVEPVNPRAANAPRQNYWHTTVYYDPDEQSAQPGARRLANAFGDAAVVRGIPATLRPLSLGAMTVVVVGKTFQNTLAPAPVDKTPRKKRPQVRRDPSETRGMLRSAQRRVPFPLMVPTLIEASSEPDTTMPIRRYWIAKHRAVRLVFRMPNGTDYWGIQQTDWKDAPILAKPSTTRFVKGRAFDLYFSGPNLRMVVLRENDATYWVVNTLSNMLSNETMLAIARGLRPLPTKAKNVKKRKKAKNAGEARRK
jgi:LCP family protein required for cell wall assembly